MAGYAQRPGVIKDLVGVLGGWLDPTATVTNGGAWVLVTHCCHGKLFADIPFTGRCKAYLGDNNKMLEYIKRLRNEKVHELMLEAANQPGNRDTLLWKRELFDLIPPIITVNVATASSMVASVNVMTSWRTRAVLQLEVTQRNIELLLEEPAADAAESAPCA